MKIFAPFVLFALLACSGSPATLDGGSKLPENPEKIIIRWYSGGGMLPEGEDIHISEDSCYWYQWQNDCERRLYFTLTKEEIRSLYDVFIEHDFDQIAVLEEQEVYDRGGTSIDVNVDGKYFQKSNSGMSFVKENSWDDYTAVEKAIYEKALEKTAHYKTTATIRLSDELISSGLMIDLTVNNDYILNSNEDTEENPLLSSFQHTVYEGENQFTVSLFNPDSLNSYGSAACLTTVWFTKCISDTCKVVTFDYEDGVLVGK